MPYIGGHRIDKETGHSAEYVHVYRQWKLKGDMDENSLSDRC